MSGLPLRPVFPRVNTLGKYISMRESRNVRVARLILSLVAALPRWVLSQRPSRYPNNRARAMTTSRQSWHVSVPFVLNWVGRSAQIPVGTNQIRRSTGSVVTHLGNTGVDILESLEFAHLRIVPSFRRSGKGVPSGENSSKAHIVPRRCLSDPSAGRTRAHREGMAPGRAGAGLIWDQGGHRTRRY